MQGHEQAVRIIRQSGAIITNDHFVYTSGRHGDVYINKDALYIEPEIPYRVSQMMEVKSPDVDTVVGIATGGIILAQHTARWLNHRPNVNAKAVFAEKEEDRLIFKRGFQEFIKGKKVLLVEDILNTGKSAKKAVQLIRKTGGDIKKVVAICNRGGVTAKDIEVDQLEFLVSVDLASWDEKECRLCAEQVPINKEFGHG